MAITFAGTKGNDTFESYATNDTFDGGAGTDIMVYNGARSNFTITRLSEGYFVTDRTNAEGKDVLQNIEQIKFGNSDPLNVEYYDVVEQLYVAYFGRATDSAALVNFAATLKSFGAPSNIQDLNAAYSTDTRIRSLIDSFGTSTESNNLYTGDTRSFVNAVFQNVLNRAPQQGGLDFWSGEIDRGALTKANAALAIMAGALANTTTQGQIDAALINNKIRVASNFTLAIDTDAEVAAYNGPTASASVRSMMSGVTAGTDVESFQTTVSSTLASLGTASPQAHAHPAEGAVTVELVGQTPDLGIFG